MMNDMITMRNINVFILLFLMTAFSLNAKPLSSIALKMGWNEGIAYDQPVKFKVEVFSQISTDKLNLNLVLPEGVVLVDGQSLSQVKVDKGQSLVVEYSVIIDKNAIGKIVSEASIGEAQDVMFRAHSQLGVALPVPTAKASQRDSGSASFSYTERNGKKLREYKLP